MKKISNIKLVKKVVFIFGKQREKGSETDPTITLLTTISFIQGGR